VKVERTLVALGLVLAVAGAAVAMNGYVYVNVERGPPMMVSGALLFGVGLVIASLGFILRELQKISADASKAALLLAKGRNGAVAAEPAASASPPPPASKPLPPLAPFEPPAATPRAGAPEPLPAKAAEAQSDPFAPPAEEKPRRPVLAPALPPRPEAPAKPLAPSLPPLSWMLKPDQVEEPARKSTDDDWLNQAIAAEAEQATRSEPSRQGKGQQDKVREDDAADAPATASSARDMDEALRREFGMNGPAQDEPSASPQQPKPEIIGNYEAHGAHYTMYADGSIEAETQHGLYRFSSIEELKRFIEGEESGEGGKAS